MYLIIHVFFKCMSLKNYLIVLLIYEEVNSFLRIHELFYVYNNIVYIRRYAPDGIVCVEGLSMACQAKFLRMLI